MPPALAAQELVADNGRRDDLNGGIDKMKVDISDPTHGLTSPTLGTHCLQCQQPLPPGSRAPLTRTGRKGKPVVVCAACICQRSAIHKAPCRRIRCLHPVTGELMKVCSKCFHHGDTSTARYRHPEAALPPASPAPSDSDAYNPHPPRQARRRPRRQARAADSAFDANNDLEEENLMDVGQNELVQVELASSRERRLLGWVGCLAVMLVVTWVLVIVGCLYGARSLREKEAVHHAALTAARGRRQ